MRSVVTVALFALVIAAASCDSTGPESTIDYRAIAVTGDELVAEAGDTLRLSFRLEGTSRVDGVRVTWTLEGTAGSITPLSDRTSTNGTASAIVRAGQGVNRVLARVDGSALAIRFIVHGCFDCGRWSQLDVTGSATSTRARAWAAAAAVAGQIWIAGGETSSLSPTSSMDVLDLATATWRRASPLPLRLAGLAMTTVRGSLYVIGGYDPDVFPWYGSPYVFVIDPATGSIHEVADMATGRFHATAVQHDGRIYVVGGRHQCGFDYYDCYSPLATVQVYDTALDRWSSLPPMQHARSMPGAAAFDGKIYVAGGNAGDDHRLDDPIETMEAFDPEANRWTRKANLPFAGPVKLAVLQGRLLAIEASGFGSVARVVEYEPASDTWHRISNGPLPLRGAVVVVADDKLYLIGGSAFDRPSQPLDAVYVLRRRGPAQGS